VEDGKFGDQKYLDDWQSRFRGVHVLKHFGGGVAPWNVQQFTIVADEKNRLFVREKRIKNVLPIVFFHFHGVKFFAGNVVQLSGALYELDEDVKRLLYAPYISTLKKISGEVKKSGAAFDPDGASGAAPGRPWNLGLALFYYLADVKASLKNITGGNMAVRKKHHHIYHVSSFAG
jgi:hypothetical protein